MLYIKIMIYIRITGGFTSAWNIRFLIQVAYGFDSGDRSRQSVIREPSVTLPNHQEPYSRG